PLISQKYFELVEGSYVSFTGEMLNPSLHLSGISEQKTSVNQSSGGSNLVKFKVTANITGTLNEMGINFDLSTDEDMTIQNELSTMSENQRSNTAINLLLYNSYMGYNSSQSNIGNNMLYSFLSSQLNNWAASAVTGVDLSFGIDQFNSSSGSTETSYSYKVSKSLFDDRFKIVVGGNYSTDRTGEENLSDKLFSDIAFEYLLNKSGSMYVRLFRHTGFTSVLEGEVTEMGAGFVFKRKLSNLKRLFRFGRKKSSTTTTTDAPADSTSAKK
ncbi:MAG: translocation/assembly module TamB domain-containing protein, partial [Bacteroidales bacterium]|nr:translocation/assembly module TamB domain-containing protein [Bacteroidales bacterium]